VTDPFVVEEVNVPVDRVDYHIETVLRMVVVFVAVQTLVIVTIYLVNAESEGVAFDFLSVWVFCHRHHVFV